jgi:hypothetical protein
MINKKNLRNLLLSDVEREIVLFEDTITLDNVETEYVDERKFFSPEVEYFCEKNFLQQQKQDKTLQDFDVLSLVNFDFYGGKVFINFEKGSFSTYLAMQKSDYSKFLADGNFFLVPLYLINILITRDNQVVLVKPSSGDPRQLVGDFLQDTDLIKGDKIDFFGCCGRHVDSQLKPALELSKTKLLGVFGLRRCCIIMEHQLAITGEELIISAKTFGKISHLVDNREDVLGDIIQNQQSYSRETRIALKFHLKSAFQSYKFINVRVK